MTIPSKRQSKSHKGRRQSHQALKPIKLMTCSNCRGMKAPHHICSHCGFYAGKDQLNLADKLQKKTKTKARLSKRSKKS